MSVSLVTPTCAPFAGHPQLCRIWPAPYHEFAEHASNEDWGTGQVWLIQHDQQIVGITGLFLEPDVDDLVYLRWTGVLPEFRRHGIAHRALQTVCHMAANTTRARTLVELVPDNDYGKTVAPFFRNFGFYELPKDTVAEETDWPTIPMGIQLDNFRHHA